MMIARMKRTCLPGIVLALFWTAGHAAGQDASVTPPAGRARLDVAGPSPGAETVRMSPPPGAWSFERGDVVLLQARDTARPQCAPLWTGAAPVPDGHAAAAVMDGDKQVKASFGDDCPAVSGGDGGVSVPDRGALHAFLGSGGLYGWFSADRGTPDMGAGINRLVSADEPFCPVFTRPNLNFEHIMNGARGDMGRATNTPRRDPMRVRLLSSSAVEVRWPAETSSWKLDCVMRYAFTGRNAVDMEFEVTPRAEEAPRGFLLFMWASYMGMVRGRTIHFPGVRGDANGWVSFGGDKESGTVAGAGQPPLQWDVEGGVLNLTPAEDVHFTKPLYYGLVDGDQNVDTTEDTMAFIMMFDAPEATRFAVWNWSESTASSAWDWQFVVREPKVGQTYRQRSRMVFKRFAGEADVLAEYEQWRAGRAADAPATALPLYAFPALLSPVDGRLDPITLGDAAADSSPQTALALYRAALGDAARRFLAASRIDSTLARQKDDCQRETFWADVCRERPDDELCRYHLGVAREDAGKHGPAMESYRETLRLRPGHPQASIRLGGLLAAGGEVEGGLKLMDAAVSNDAGTAGTATRCCGRAAESRLAAGDAAGALVLLRRARALSPDDMAYRVALGEALEAAHDDAGALDEYRAVLSRYPESPRSAARMDAVLARAGIPEKRIGAWRSLVELHPDGLLPRTCLGNALEDAGDTAGAGAAYEEALRLHPDAPEPALRMGAIKAGRGDVEGGLKAVDAAVAKQPDLAWSAAEACARAAAARLAAEDAASAVILLRRARVLSPDDLRYRVSLGGAMEAAGDDAGALSEYRAVLAEVPESPKTSARMDAVYLRRGDTAARIGEWRRIVADHPEAAIPQLHLGLALEAAGDADAAQRAFAKALEINPALEEAKAALDRMVVTGTGGR